MVRRKYTNATTGKRRSGGRKNSARPPSTSSSGGASGSFRAVSQIAHKSGAVGVRRSNKPTDYGGAMTVYSENAQVPRPIIPENRIYSIRQEVATFNTQSGISGSGSYPYFAAQDATQQFPVIGFEFQDLDQEASLANLFDQYKFDLVEIIIKPSNSGVDLHAAASPNQINPQVIAVLDFDDSTPLTSIAAARQYDNAVVFMGAEGVHIRIVPAVTPAVYSGGAFTGYGVTGPMWLDCNSNTVPHYGVKFAVQGLSTASTEFYQWNIQTWYHMSFRNVR